VHKKDIQTEMSDRGGREAAGSGDGGNAGENRLPHLDGLRFLAQEMLTTSVFLPDYYCTA